jgi:hypothetical protein
VIEHEHWKRKDLSGIAGHHIAIVGYSHYRDKKAADHSQFTIDAVNKVISGKDKRYGGAMFSSVPGYFGDYKREDFWRKVHFFNFVADAFFAHDKFAIANSQQVEVAQKRFKDILRKELPDKVFIFSRKAWSSCPPTLEEMNGLCVPLTNNAADNWGTYEINGKLIRVCGFRHPLRASSEKMRTSVQEFLDLD